MNPGARDRAPRRARLRTVCAQVALATLCLGPSPATLGQEFPSRPVRWVIPFGPGTIFETAARFLIPGMSASFGQPVVIENRPGAGALIGTEYVARQVAPDGHTMLMGLANLLTFKLFVKDLRFDPTVDLVPASLLLETPVFVAANARQPYDTLEGLIAHAKAHPGKLNYGTSGPQSYPELMFQALQARYGVRMESVAYKDGNTAVLTGLLADQVQLAIAGQAISLGDVRAGRLRALVVSGSRRLASLPEVPSAQETGYVDLIPNWYSIHLPAATPRAVVARIGRAALEALQDPDTRTQLEKNYFTILALGPQESERHIRSDEQLYRNIVTRAGLQAR